MNLPAPLSGALGGKRASDPGIRDLFRRFLKMPRYSRAAFRALAGIGRGETHASWEVRSMAALMLEEMLAGLCAPGRSDVRHILSTLGFEAQLPEWLLAEGFSTLDPGEFFGQLRRKMSRLPIAPVTDRSQGEWEWWLRRARQECRLSLGRYLFKPEEVVERALRQMDISEGTPDGLIPELPAMDDPPRPERFDPRRYEAAILQMLACQGRVYWVAERTSSELNSLVEYPTGTIVLIVRPPGSDLEIEIKRAGMRCRLFGVLYKRDGEPLPIPHRLQGGSMGSTLEWEGRKSLDFSVFVAASGRRAAMSRMIGLTRINTIPAGGENALILDYFTDEDVFGDGFSDMRREMSEVVAAANGEDEGLTGLALTVAFIGAMKPSQAILAGTSSFRLDRVAASLADGNVAHTGDMLEQILGVVDWPSGVTATVAEVFQVPTNRCRADQAFLRCMTQIANFCGALWSLGGYSNGESLVERNVGILRKWESGEWISGLVSMDHDGLIIPGPDTRNFRPAAVLGGMKADERYLFGRLIGHGTIRGAIPSLREIYRVSVEIEAEGDRVFRAEMARTRRALRQAMMPRGRLRRYIPARYIQQLFDFQTLTGWLLEEGSASAGWRDRSLAFLMEKGYNSERSVDYIDAICTDTVFLLRNPEIFGTPQETPN